MDKAYIPKTVEQDVYLLWEKGSPSLGYGGASGYFTPTINLKKRPFSILLPLPNANDPMHMGHAMFIVQDILIRYHRMKGDPTLWLPGGDHAGIETQFVFEKKLAREGKSRFDYDRDTLYKMIAEFVDANKNINRDQMKRLGFSLDWTRYHYSLEPKIIEQVLKTFVKLHEDKLLYRAEKLVNYCTKCGTSFSDLEVKHVEQIDKLYYMKYGPFILATTRPETKFGDTAVAVHPKDKRYQEWIGKEIEFEGLNGKVKLTVVADDVVDPAFGTGVVKVTPAHDMTDYEIGIRHKLPMKQVIGLDGKLTSLAGPYAGLRVKAAREKVVADLTARGMIDHIDEAYVHSVGTCYKCGTILEPLPLPQWFVKTKPLAEKAITVVKEGKTKIVPLKRFEKLYFDWLTTIHDWNISRQIVWGPRIPVWYCVDCNKNIKLAFIDAKGQKNIGTYEELKPTYSFDEIVQGLQSVIAPIVATYELQHDVCGKCHGKNLIQETDTFDTWFLSGQWPLTTLGYPEGQDFKYFYPTSVLDTMWDILFFWVARMMMFGLYLTGKPPFEIIHLHSRVVDSKGQKMSKSKGNVVNPIELVDTYGADALRMALTFGAAPGSDISLSEDKVRGMRNFANKLWNIARLFLMNMEGMTKELPEQSKDTEIMKKLHTVVVDVTKYIEKYRFSDAAQTIYEFTWHTVADSYLEENKELFKQKNLQALADYQYILIHILKLLHPFMPFVTESIWGQISRKHDQPLIISSWPLLNRSE
ncbi:MAG: Valine-tRNA ligase [Microgenomates group bacterium GW2011_GWC1_39_12]|nr:MAG: Valine-tRNA ligase [Microgenomates group bacterium GW2011_GWC1_39_12]